jgi:hypothetical protein
MQYDGRPLYRPFLLFHVALSICADQQPSPPYLNPIHS